ncbi:MAG: tetratricopeptide repeat protein [Deltaproteobacteria bacterium]|jgi:CHAT domain-containing protein/tetratricopeptide (TPR) repeat protein|nr:tetratricopeptide repeat protein [Deltaproteobacteria bacterium]
MEAELEKLKTIAQEHSEGRRHGEAARAWRELALRAEALWGELDPRTVAAGIRMIRERLDFEDGTGGYGVAEAVRSADGTPGWEVRGDSGGKRLRESARKSAAAAAEAFGEKSGEALFARETALLAGMGDDPAAARRGLDELRRLSAGELGPAHPQTLSLRRSLALAALLAGDVPSASAGLADAARECLREFPDGCSDALRAASAMSSVMFRAGDYPQARKILSAALELGERRLGREHPQTVLARANLGHVLGRTEEMARGKELLEDALASMEISPGRNHDRTLMCRNNLAAVLQQLGENARAAELFREVLDARTGARGAGHRLSLMAKSNLAVAMRSMGRLGEARELHEEVLAAWTATLGPHHEETVQSAGNLASVLLDLGENAEARALLEDALAAQERVLGAGHPSTVKSRLKLGTVLSASGDLAGAVRMKRRALADAAGRYGPLNPLSLYASNSLAATLFELGDYAAARDAYRAVSDARQTSLPPGHPDRARTLSNLARAAGAAGDRAFEADALRRALAEASVSMGPAHPDSVAISMNLAAAVAAAGDPADATAVLSDALAASRTVLGPDHPEILRLKTGLAEALSASGKGGAAREMLREVLEAAIVKDGPDGLLASAAAAALGRSYAGDGEVPSAIFFLKISVDSAQRVRTGISGLERELRRTYLARTEANYRALFDLLVSEGRHLEALAVLGLLKDGELSGLEEAGRYRGEASEVPSCSAFPPEEGSRGIPAPASAGPRGGAADAAPASTGYPDGPPPPAPGERGGPTSPGGPCRGSGPGTPTGPDLFGGTGDEEPWAVYRDAADALTAQAVSPAPPAVSPKAQADSPVAQGDSHEAMAGSPANSQGGSGGNGREPNPAAPKPETADFRVRPAGASKENVRAAAPPAGPDGPADVPASPPEGPGAGPGTPFARLSAGIPRLLRSSAVQPDESSWAARSVRSRQAAIRAMGPGAALLIAVSAEHRLHLLTLTPEGVTARTSDVGRGELAKLSREFRAIAGDAALDPRPLGKRLYGLVMAPVEEDLEAAGVTTLMLQLDGELRYAPAAALWDGERWLCERWATALFTESTPLRLADAPFAGKPSVRAMGVTRAWPGFRALPGVAAEIAAVVRTRSAPGGALEGEASLDGDFTRETFRASLASEVPVMHVASHFRLDPESLDGTVLLMGDGTTVSLREFASGGDLDFRGLDLLALSACDTASGSRGGEGREVESLAETVQRAGASAVLATLMPVDDRSAPELMREFYRLRYVEGMDKAEALRRAQLKVMLDGTAPPPVPDLRAAPAPPPGQSPPAPASRPAPHPAASSPSAAASGTPSACSEDSPAGSCGNASPEVAAAPRGISLAAAGIAGQGPGAPPPPRWEGTGFSHPYYWSPFVVMGAWK